MAKGIFMMIPIVSFIINPSLYIKCSENYLILKVYMTKSKTNGKHNFRLHIFQNTSKSQSAKSQFSWYGIFCHPLIQMHKNDHCAVYHCLGFPASSKTWRPKFKAKKGWLSTHPRACAQHPREKNLLNFLAGRNLHFPFFFGGEGGGSNFKVDIPSVSHNHHLLYVIPTHMLVYNTT